MSIFGPMVPSGMVEAAVLATCNLWMEDYLAEVERQQGLAVGKLARWRSEQTSYEFENWKKGQLPALVAVCAGTSEVEHWMADGYRAWFEVAVGVLVEDTTEANARRVSQLHQAAIDGILIQHPSLGGFASDTILFARQTHLPNVTNRTVSLAESIFRIAVDGIVDPTTGPRTPSPTPDQPPADLPTVDQVDVGVLGVTGFDP